MTAPGMENVCQEESLLFRDLPSDVSKAALHDTGLNSLRNFEGEAKEVLGTLPLFDNLLGLGLTQLGFKGRATGFTFWDTSCFFGTFGWIGYFAFP